MIRRDYILRMIEEFMQSLSRLRALKQDQRWGEANEELDEEFKKLVGDGAEAARLSESDLLTRLMQDGPTHLVPEKTLMLTTLLTQAGDVAAAENREAESRECYLKALHLLLEIHVRDDFFESPAFVPKVEMLHERLQGQCLPLRTLAALMQHYVRAGEFAKAEDELFTMFEAEPNNDAIKDFGIQFYQRLQAQSDEALAAGNLPRAEVEDGLKNLQQR